MDANYESRTVQVYPSDYEERKAISVYERGGWELTNNVRNQERHGDTISTFIRLSFRRNKNMPNYEKIKELSADAEYLIGKEASGGTSHTNKAFILGLVGLVFFPLCFIFWILAAKAYKKGKKELAEAQTVFDERERLANEKLNQCAQYLP